ncbi:MAG: hypothetical protein R6V58_06475, partial [Planctomycetota bacterium]
ISILKGNISGVIEHLGKKMHDLAVKMNFEDAQKLKEKRSATRRSIRGITWRRSTTSRRRATTSPAMRRSGRSSGSRSGTAARCCT